MAIDDTALWVEIQDKGKAITARIAEAERLGNWDVVCELLRLKDGNNRKLAGEMNC